jgi:murein L,D-transpeptidase YcbB/YkuD
VVDSVFIRQELERDSSLRPYSEDILDFYQRRNYEAAWMEGDTLTLSATDFINTLRSYGEEFGDSSLSVGLDDQGIGATLIVGSIEGRTMLDLRLTATFFKYAQRAYGGTSADPRDLEWYIPRLKKDYRRLIDSLVSSPATFTAYEPVNAYYKSLKKILAQYRAIERRGGLPVITGGPLHRGDSSDAVTLLKRSLAMTHDYLSADTSALYTDTLAYAVASCQHRLGLRETGAADSLTLTEINTPIAYRIRQIMLNMERLRWMPDSLPARYILVNIPEYRLHFFDRGGDSLSMDVVVGRAATATSIFTGRLSVVSFSPYWNVPQSIIRHEMLPALRRSPDYLATHHMELLRHGEVIDPSGIDWSKYSKGLPYDIRQLPGTDNALGLVAFFFPNSFDIYLHDTPAKSFFSENTRAFSHGCIRLAKPEQLADYIFKNDTSMSPAHIRELMDAHVNKKVSVQPSIPVYIAYFTAWVDEAGRVNFRHDIYGHDARLAQEIFGK